MHITLIRYLSREIARPISKRVVHSKTICGVLRRYGLRIISWDDPVRALLKCLAKKKMSISRQMLRYKNNYFIIWGTGTSPLLLGI